MLRENLQEVEERIQEACRRACRDRSEVTLVAVSKTKPVDMLREAYDLGVRVFGENKVQEIREKYEMLPKDIQWHMIGHLQTNKVKYIVDKVKLIHSVDSLRLAEVIEKEAEKHDRTVDILLEVNVAEEESKFGVRTSEVLSLAEKVVQLPHIRLRGLMTIFANLHDLYVDIKEKNIDNGTVSILSMGMTNDYEVAIEEGATMVRVGTGIFGARDYSI